MNIFTSLKGLVVHLQPPSLITSHRLREREKEREIHASMYVYEFLFLLTSSYHNVVYYSEVYMGYNPYSKLYCIKLLLRYK